MTLLQRILNWITAPTSTAVPRCPPLLAKTSPAVELHSDTSVVSGPPPSPKSDKSKCSDYVHNSVVSGPAPSPEDDRIKYSDYVHKIICMDKSMTVTSELLTWGPALIQFLVDHRIIANPPGEGEQIRIIIKKHESDGTEPWNN